MQNNNTQLAMNTNEETRASARHLYNLLVEKYSGNVNTATKQELLRNILHTFTALRNYPDRIAEFKKLLDVQFAKDVKCSYAYLVTPNNSGCDLREIVFNIDGSTTKEGKKLLKMFDSQSSPKQRKIHVLTDIDDTLYANTMHNTYISGRDTSWPQKIPYPGVAAFYAQLHKLPVSTGYTTVLSATPGFLKKGKLHSHELQSILGDKYGFIQGEERKRNIMAISGSIVNTWWKSGDNPGSSFYAAIADTKFQRFVQYARIFPERKLIWIGDNGQGDALAGSKMLNTYGKRVKVFIHMVGEITVNDARIRYFTSYVELAKIFQQLKIFEDEDVAIIMRSAGSDCTAASGATDKQKLIHCFVQPQITAGSKTRANGTRANSTQANRTQSNRNRAGRRTQSKTRGGKRKKSTKQAQKRSQTGRNSRK